MENNNQRSAAASFSGATNTPGAAIPTPLFADATRANTTAVPTTAPPPSGAPQPAPTHSSRKLLVRSGIALLILLLLGAGVLLVETLRGQSQQDASLNSAISNTTIPLSDFANSANLSLLGTQSLTVNGQLRANASLIVTPSAKPTSTEKGQIYYDQTSNQLAYYNGTDFVPLGNTTSTFVQSVGGQTGQLTLGAGLAGGGGQISNSGVLSLQGQTGNVSLVAGPGVAINGTTISNSGVTDLGGQTGSIVIGNGLSITNGTLQNAGIVSAVSGSANITVTNDGAGNITISSTGGGSGTVVSPGGTAGKIAKFTGVQTIADSLLSESGSVVTVGGDLSVTGGLTLGTALGVNNGGTGATSLANNGVLLGQGTGAVTAVTAGGSGLCLVSNVGAPSFQACPGSGGVTSVDGLTGALTVANTTGSGSTITIDDASTSQKGIAQFNSTNFTASSGTINTVQDINVTAAPTFGRLTVTSSQATSPMLLVNNTNAGASGNLLDLQLNGSSKLAVSPSGALTLAGTINGQTISNAANFTGSMTVNGLASLSGGATVTGTLTANTITPSSALTVGATSQSFLLQGNTSSTITATSGANKTTVAFATPTANRTITLPDESGTVCLQGSSNCGFAAASGSGNYIQNTTLQQSASNFYISGTGNAATALQAPVIDSITGALGIGTTNATAINLNQNTTLAAGKTLTVTSALTSLSAGTTGDALSVSNATSTGNIAVFKDNATPVLTIGDGGATTLQNETNQLSALQILTTSGSGAHTLFNADTINERVGIGGVATASKLEIQGGDAAIYNSGNNPKLFIGDSTSFGHNGFLMWDSTNSYLRLETAGTNGLKLNDNFLAVGNIFPDQPLKIGNGSTLLHQIDTTGEAMFQTSTNSTNAFSILNSTSVPQFVTDTANSRVYIGNPTADTTGALLVLDTKSGSGDPTGVNGGMYYNANSGKFRCYENGNWKNCLGLTATITLNGTNGSGTASQWTSMPSALTEAFGTSNARVLYDLTDATQVRFQVNVNTVGAASAEIRIQYSTDQSTWNYLDNGATGLGQNISTTGFKTSAWSTIASGARGDVYLRAVGINGDGTTSPRLGLIQIQAR